MARTVEQLVIAPETIEWLAAAVADSDKTETGARDQAVRQLKAERDRFQARIDTMYLDRLDGRISAEFFDEKSKAWREHQKQIDAKLGQLATTGLRSAVEAVQIMKSFSDACAGFGDGEPQQKRALAAALMQNPTWKARGVREFQENAVRQNGTFELCNRTKEREKSDSGQDFEILLPVVDAFRTSGETLGGVSNPERQHQAVETVRAKFDSRFRAHNWTTHRECVSNLPMQEAGPAGPAPYGQ